MTVNKNYFSDLSKFEGLSETDLLNLFEDYKLGNQKAYNKLVESNLKLVVYYAKQYWKIIKDHKMIEFNDLVSEGNLGLINAIKNYDITKEIKFAYYSGFWIKKAILEFILTNNTNGIREPEPKHTATTKIQKRVDELFQIEQMEITDAYLHFLNEFTPREIEHYFSTVQFVEPSNPIIDSSQQTYELEVLMIKHLDKLTNKEQFVLKMHYGLGQGKVHKLKEIAEMMNVTPQRVYELKMTALKKLKKKLKNEI
ncbi:sigma-70 family RNA polymerase sigma factor [Flavobacterium enshiense]|uniref:sigma-70 family RNA polymerase sigma factor n=1 Tax=Flavobacterium enshiense TaxID=1341165 RepID=UPI00345CF46D